MGLPKSNCSSKRFKFSLKEGQKKDNHSNRSQLHLAKEGAQEEQTSDNQRRSRPNRFFYRVSNHQELFEIGKSFYDDYLSGVKSFAISSTGYQTSQQKTILGLSSFFDHKEDLFKIAIISDNLDEGAFGDIVSICKPVSNIHVDSDKAIDIRSFYDHFDFIDLNQILELSQNEEEGEFDSIFDRIVDSYDILFWDVPELHKIQLHSEVYFPMIMKFESLTVIVSKEISTQSEIDELKQFFLGYGINLKGLLFDDKNISKEKEKKSTRSKQKKVKTKRWWRRFFT